MTQSNLPKISGLELRYTTLDDASYLKSWLLQPGVLAGFPMCNEAEVQDSVNHWIGFSKCKSSLTATLDGKPVGIATLCLMPYKKVMHQCLLSIIVSEECRNRGVGTLLINNLLHLAKERFAIDVVYLEVYEGIPAINLYRRFGFKEVGVQKRFMRENGKYIGKIIMERVL